MPPRAATKKPTKARSAGRRGARKTTGKTTGTSAVPVGAMIPQPHGGALRNGGPNAGGSGRPRNEIRDRLAAIVDEDGVAFIRGVVRGEVATRLVSTCEHCGKEPSAARSADEIVKSIPAIADRVAAFDKAARYGIGTTKEITVDHVTGRLEETYRILLAHLDAETFARIDAELGKVWQ